MRAGITCCLIFLAPLLVTAAEPGAQYGNNADQRARVTEALERKLAEAEKLQSEIERLRKLATTPRPEVRLRVRIIEASLDKIKQLGLPWPHSGGGDAPGVESQLATMLPNHVAKLLMDKTLSLADGEEGRIRAGAEFPVDLLAKVNADPAKFAFRGTELAATPKSQTDGRLAIELVCKQFKPILYSDLGPQLQVDEVSTDVKLAPGEVIVLKGAKQERTVSTMTGFSKSGLDIGVVTETVHHLQTFVVVSREPLLTAAEPMVR